MDHMLTFERGDDDQSLVVHGDEQGLTLLRDTIDRLVRRTRPGHFDHQHMKTPDWGGNELSNERQGGELIHHVEIYCWKGDKAP